MKPESSAAEPEKPPQGRPIGDDEIGDDELGERLSLELLREPCLVQSGVGRHVGPTLHALRPAADASWWIELRVENGVVTLDGNVRTAEQKRVAATLASRIRGTRGVINALTVEEC